jgi:hypothetical protein
MIQIDLYKTYDNQHHLIKKIFTEKLLIKKAILQCLFSNRREIFLFDEYLLKEKFIQHSTKPFSGRFSDFTLLSRN